MFIGLFGAGFRGLFVVFFIYGGFMGLIVYGPQGCGKTTRAQQIADFFGLTRIVDNGVDEAGQPWAAGDVIDSDTLVLTNDPTRYDFEFGQVMSVIEQNA